MGNNWGWQQGKKLSIYFPCSQVCCFQAIDVNVFERHQQRDKHLGAFLKFVNRIHLSWEMVCLVGFCNEGKPAVQQIKVKRGSQKEGGGSHLWEGG